MTVYRYDPNAGIYHFGATGLHARSHDHPIAELIWAEEGEFTIEREGKACRTSAAFISPNELHAIRMEAGARTQLLYIDAPDKSLTAVSLDLLDCVNTAPSKVEHAEVIKICRSAPVAEAWDERVAECLHIIDRLDADFSYGDLMPLLTTHCHLSASRLSHVFKAGMGTTIRRYFRWVKLKQAIGIYLDEAGNLTSAGLAGGFYDQAHFSSAFVEFMGLPPSRHYNSHIVQFRDVRPD